MLNFSIMASKGGATRTSTSNATQKRTRLRGTPAFSQPRKAGVRLFGSGGVGAMFSRRFDKDLFALAIPALGSSVMEPMLALADTLFVSLLGSIQLASLAPCSSVFSVIAGLSYAALTTATSVILCNSIAAGKHENTKAVIRTATVAALAVGAGLTLYLSIGTESILSTLGASTTIMPHSVAYLRWRAFGIPFYFLSLISAGIFRALKDTKTVFVVSLAAGIVNIVLDAFLVLVMNDGVRGAAVATSISQVASAGIAAFALYKRRAELGMDKATSPPKESTESDSALVAQSVRDLGSSSMTMILRQTCNNGIWLFSTALVTRLGDAQAATHHAIISVWVVLAFINECVATSGQVTVASTLNKGGQLYTATARRVAMRTVLLSVGLAGVLIPVGHVLHSTVLKPMLGTVLTIELSDQVFPMVLLFLPLQYAVWTLDALFLGASDFRYNAVAVSSSAGICVLTLCFIGNSFFSVWAVMSFGYFGLRLVTHLLRFSSPKGPFISSSPTVPIPTSSTG
mmetsp:Transcript_17633/g.71251  ORF Transcript_17633/g.71251 Transcript_17633/m.71251 type:complete len:514 (-) Transcript_17633:427-1968(-)